MLLLNLSNFVKTSICSVNMNDSNGFQKKCLNPCLISLLTLTTGNEEPKATVQNFLKSNSHLPKNLFLFASMIAIQKWWKMLFNYLKSSFRSQDISIFVLPFWSCRKNGLIREVNFEIHDVTAWLTNNYNTHITQYLPN